MYVDDVFFGADTIQEAKHLGAQLCEFLMAGGFPLRKWAANHPDLLSQFPVEWLAEEPVNDSLLSKNHPLLGLIWNSESDIFSFSADFPELCHPISKRQVLSLLAKIYDPLGLLSPLTIRSKIFFQSLWTYQNLEDSEKSSPPASRLNWDDHLPESLSEKWQSIYTDLKNVKSLTVPRWINFQANSQVEIHGFSDASKDALATFVYLRILNLNDSSVSLLAAKTKVAPIKTLSTPRLELCAALLLSKLVANVQRALHLNNHPVHLWADSSVALAWICSPSYFWQTFVANRTAEISRLVPSACWHYIEGEINPADAPSRGITYHELELSNLWWHGPDFLNETSESQFENFSTANFSTCSERRKTVQQVSKSAVEEHSIISHFSSLSRLLRVVSWMRKFISNSFSNC